MCIVLVEGEVLIRMYVSDMLSARGLRVIEAVSADEALVMLSAHADVSVLVTDVKMPGTMDGLPLATTVADRWPDIAIVICSGHAVADDGAPEGAVVLRKPFSSEALLAEAAAANRARGDERHRAGSGDRRRR